MSRQGQTLAVRTSLKFHARTLLFTRLFPYWDVRTTLELHARTLTIILHLTLHIKPLGCPHDTFLAHAHWLFVHQLFCTQTLGCSHYTCTPHCTTRVHFTHSQTTLDRVARHTREVWPNGVCGPAAWSPARESSVLKLTTWRGQGARPSRPRSPVQTTALMTHGTEETVSLLMVKQKQGALGNGNTEDKGWRLVRPRGVHRR